VGATIVGLPAPRTEEEPNRIELKVDRLLRKRAVGSPETQNTRRQSRFLNALRTTRSTAVPENQVSMLLPNVGRITLDNFAVLRYGRPPVRRSGIPSSGFASRLPVQRFTLHNFNPLNEILYCFSRKSVPWFNLDTLTYKRFGTNAGADTQAASE
jgi:hypothetical protein